MAKDVKKLIPVRPAYLVKRGAVKCESSLGVKYCAVAIFDSGATDSSGAANTTIASHGLGVYLPANAVIVNAFYDVSTKFATASADAGTIALGYTGATGAFVAAIAVSAAGDVYDQGVRGTLIGTPSLDGNARTAIAGAAAIAGAMTKLTAEKELVATVAGQVLTAGKLVLFVEYYISAANA